MNSKIIETKSFEKLLNSAVEKTAVYGDANIERLTQVLYVYKVMQALTKGCGAKVSYELHEDFKGMGSVLINAPHLEFSDYQIFSEVSGFANNFEVYAKTDGTVQMNFAFYGLLKKPDEEV